jgi:hypothetical protein
LSHAAALRARLTAASRPKALRRASGTSFRGLASGSPALAVGPVKDAIADLMALRSDAMSLALAIARQSMLSVQPVTQHALILL